MRGSGAQIAPLLAQRLFSAVFPRLHDVRYTRHTGLQCPNVLYRKLNATHWLFHESRDLPFKARPL